MSVENSSQQNLRKNVTINLCSRMVVYADRAAYVGSRNAGGTCYYQYVKWNRLREYEKACVNYIQSMGNEFETLSRSVGSFAQNFRPLGSQPPSATFEQTVRELRQQAEQTENKFGHLEQLHGEADNYAALNIQSLLPRFLSPAKLSDVIQPDLGIVRSFGGKMTTALSNLLESLKTIEQRIGYIKSLPSGDFNRKVALKAISDEVNRVRQHGVTITPPQELNNWVEPQSVSLMNEGWVNIMIRSPVAQSWEPLSGGIPLRMIPAGYGAYYIVYSFYLFDRRYPQIDYAFCMPTEGKATYFIQPLSVLPAGSGIGRWQVCGNYMVSLGHPTRLDALGPNNGNGAGLHGDAKALDFLVFYPLRHDQNPYDITRKETDFRIKIEPAALRQNPGWELTGSSNFFNFSF